MRALIVEDDALSRELLRELLQPVAECDTAENGHEALAAVRRSFDENKSYDLMCLDIMMPEMDGHEALELIRAEEAKRGLHGLDGMRIVMITALADAKNVFKAFRAQCEAYVTKPIDPHQFYKQLQELGLIDASSDLI